MPEMARYYQHLLACLALLALQVSADCSVTGLDYTNGGSYLIDATSDSKFTFTSLFRDCANDNVTPILISPKGQEFTCSTVTTTANNGEELSTCPVSYNQMSSGVWTIIIQAENVDLAVQRTFTLNVGVPQKTVITLTPTVIVGVTSTPSAEIIETTLTSTATIVFVPSTSTAHCNFGTQTVTKYIQPAPTTLTSTVLRGSTGSVTSKVTTTVAVTATCHRQATTTKTDSPPPIQSQPNGGRPWYTGGGWGQRGGGGQGGGRGGDWGGGGGGSGGGSGGGWGGGGGGRGGGGGGRGGGGGGRGGHPEVPAIAKRNFAVVAALTSTVYETTYTVTSTSVVLAQPTTTVETYYVGVSRTVTAPAETVCDVTAAKTLTVMSVQPQQTETRVSLVTTATLVTVWVGQMQYSTHTQANAATACWQAGGWYGI